MANNAMYKAEDFEETMTLSFDDTGDIECGILAIYSAGGRDYIALYPLEQEAGDEFFIYRYMGENEEEIMIEDLESDEEFDIASQGYDDFMENLDVEDLFED